MDLTTKKLVRLASLPLGHVVVMHSNWYRNYGLTIDASTGAEPLPAALLFSFSETPRGTPVPSVFLDDVNDPLLCVDLGPAAIEVDPRDLGTYVDGERDSDLMIGYEGAAMLSGIQGQSGRYRWLIEPGKRLSNPDQLLRVRKWSIGTRVRDTFTSLATFGEAPVSG